jgi:hypothetical protein
MYEMGPEIPNQPSASKASRKQLMRGDSSINCRVPSPDSTSPERQPAVGIALPFRYLVDSLVSRSRP